MNTNQTAQHNLRKGKDLIGLKILTYEEGKLIKNVDELVFDPMTNQVKALVVDPQGWFSDAEVVLFEDIKSIGTDSVVVESEEMIKKASEIQEAVSRIIKDDNYLTDNKVMTEEGNELGKISDIYFDSTTGDVIELEVTQGALKNVQSGRKRVKVADIVKVGEDAIIVNGYVEETLEEQGKEQGLQGAVNTARDKAPGVMEQTKQKLTQFGQTVKQEAQELSERAKQKAEAVSQDPETQQTVSSIQSKATETKTSLEQKAAEATKKARDTIQQGKQKIEEQRRKDALGKYVTVNILSVNDHIFANRGDMVTNALLVQAEQEGLLDKVLNNTSKEPIDSIQSPQET